MTKLYSNVLISEDQSVGLASASFPNRKYCNDRFPLKFHRCGHMIEGVILATGLEPIPKEYVQAMTVPVKLTFEDQFGNEISAEKELSVDRSTKPSRDWCAQPVSMT